MLHMKQIKSPGSNLSPTWAANRDSLDMTYKIEWFSTSNSMQEKKKKGDAKIHVHGDVLRTISS